MFSRLTTLAAVAIISASPLAAEEFTELAARCAPGIAPETLAAVARVESGFSPLAIHDNTSRQSYQPQDKAEAIGIARRLLSAGHSLDLGLMQVNNRNFDWVGLTIEDAFEPCPSIKAGAAVLTSFSQYNTGSVRRGFANGYVARIVKSSLAIKGGEVDVPRAATPAATPTAAKASSRLPPDNPFVRPARTMPEMVFFTARR